MSDLFAWFETMKTPHGWIWVMWRPSTTHGRERICGHNGRALATEDEAVAALEAFKRLIATTPLRKAQ